MRTILQPEVDDMLGMSQGLNLANLNETTQQEVEDHLAYLWTQHLADGTGRGPLYEMYANSLMLDYAPDIAKLHRWGADIFRLTRDNQVKDDFNTTLPYSFQQLHSYIMLGWETGIRKQFLNFKRWGFRKSQIMEVVMFTRLSAGMRGLGHVYHAVGDMLPDYQDGHGNPPYPEGWAADPAAFKSGLDLTTRDLTNADRKNLTDWYEKTIGYLPRSVAFGMRHDPPFLKVHRAMWEAPIKTIPKQAAPFMMLRDAMLNNDRDALREAALLSKAWGITEEWLVRGITQTAHYFTSLRGLYAAYDAIEDLLTGESPVAS
jgi:hypothetical protein